MKLRIKGNSIRLRLTQTEVNQFQEEGVVREIIKFGNSALMQMNYTMQISSGTEVDACYKLNEMIINIPIAIAKTWTSTNQVGFQNKMFINETEDLHILVEKDFQCLQLRPNEDETDMFPNPADGILKC